MRVAATEVLVLQVRNLVLFVDESLVSTKLEGHGFDLYHQQIG